MASEVGVIVAVTSWNSPGAMVATVSGLNVTVQPVGAEAEGVTCVIGAVPLFVIRMTKSVADPALALVESTWLGVDTATVKLPVITAASWIWAVSPPPVAVTISGNVPAWVPSGAFAVAVTDAVEPGLTTVLTAWLCPAGVAVTVHEASGPCA